MDHGAAVLRLLYHVGLVAAADVDDARQQPARLAVHLYRYRLARLQSSTAALRQTDAAVRAYLKPGLPQYTASTPAGGSIQRHRCFAGHE